MKTSAKTRTQSPSPSQSSSRTHHHARSRAYAIAAINSHGARCRRMEWELKRYLLYGPLPPQALTPRAQVVEDVKRAKVFVKVEIPGADPKDVKLTLDGTRLRITGERSPDLSDVPEEYRDELGAALSQSDLYGVQRAKLIFMGDGFVKSVPPNGVQGLFNRAQSPSAAPNVDAATSASPSGAHLRPERSFYDELRYGTFCRDFRVGPGTKPSDIQGYFSNGMLMLSWPHPKAPTSANVESESDMDVEDNIIPNASATPVSVKVESSNVDDEPQH